jgi:hypothetical protein
MTSWGSEKGTIYLCAYRNHITFPKHERIELR